MTKETLYDAITDVSDELIEESERYAFRKKGKWRRYAAMAAVFALVIGGYGVVTGRLPLLGASTGGNGNAGGEDGYSYMNYIGPVLPLTAADDAAGITAERSVDYDFSPYISREVPFSPEERTEGDPYSYFKYQSEAIVTDEYILRNETDGERTLTLLYPVELRMTDSLNRLPTITVDGVEQEAALHIAPYSGGFADAWGGSDPNARLNLDEISDWQGYVNLLEDGSYQAAAFAPYPVLDVPVTVYKVDDYAVAPTEAANPSLQISFSADFNKTTVMTLGSNGGTNDAKTGRCTRIVGGLGSKGAYRPGPMYIILYGDDIEGYTLQGYANMGGNAGEEIDVSATVTRYETTMEEILRMIVDERFAEKNSVEYGNGEETVASVIPYDMLRGAAADLLVRYGVFSEIPAERYDTGMLEDVFEAYSMQRVMYAAFDVTIPAHGSVSVTATMHKDNSCDFIGKKKNVDGYDLATRLGSTLTFTGQRASVSNTEEIRIAENSFGFDLDAGVTQVTLDPEVEHYWMQVEKIR
ncbi:MAG: hypothetical protein II079_07085 [Oscillospiraceae bacterium]|nr:hypothetical protein [Oscillospiraceae bacterium]